MASSYDLFEHRHRFAVWAAARAAQRGFTDVENLRAALEDTHIKCFLKDAESLNINEANFELKHRKWCNKIIDYLTQKLRKEKEEKKGKKGKEEKEEKKEEKVTYGRAAKLVAVYLKAMVVTGPDSDSKLAAVAHPPIDRLLLQKLAKSGKGSSGYRTAWRKATWTTLDEEGYFTLLKQLEAVKGDQPWWTLEEYWDVTNESGE